MTTEFDPMADLLLELDEHELEFVDKRGNGGQLWIVGGSELGPIIGELQNKHGIEFHHAARGGRATRRRPAWWAATPKVATGESRSTP